MQQKWQRTTLHNLLLYKERRTPEWLVRLHTGTERIQEEAGTAKQKLDGHCQMRSEGFGHYQGFSFRGCFRRRILKPMDDIVVSLMKSLQPAGELCLRAVVNNVRHRLPLSALTQVRLSHAPTMEAGTAGTVGKMASASSSPSSWVPGKPGETNDATRWPNPVGAGSRSRRLKEPN